MPLVAEQPGTKYEQLAEHLRDMISSQSLQPGDALPSLSMLRRDLRVGQTTYERAQTLLEREGLVLRHPGRGSFVAHRRQAKFAGAIAIAGLGPIGRTSEGYWAELFEGIRDAAREERKSITLIDENDEHPDWANIGGLIVGDEYRAGSEAQVPCVSLMRPVAKYMRECARR